MSNPLVKQLQQALGVTADGVYGPATHSSAMKALGRPVAPSSGGSRKIGAKGLALIKEFEGLRLDAYPDPATGGEPITIGYGSTGGYKLGQRITEAEAEALLRHDLQRFERAVSGMVTREPTQNQFDAMVSLAFNVGEGNLKSSTLLKLHNAGDFAGAQGQFVRWNKAAGKVMAGLTRRREAEARLYGEPA